MKFEITIPVLNEAATIERQVLTLLDFLASKPRPVEYVVTIADNGSSDGTRAIVQRMALARSDIRLVSVPERGVGRGLKAAWDQSDADVLGYLDLDFSTPVANLDAVFETFQRSEVMVLSASRYKKGAEVIGRRPLRTVTSIGLNLILKILLRVKFTDAMVGFKFLRRDLYTQLRQSGLQNNGWFFNAELLIRSEWLGHLVHEIPVRWEDDPNSKVNLAGTIKEYLKNIIDLYRERRKTPPRRGR